MKPLEPSSMNLKKAITDLIANREHIDEAISLERTLVPMPEERITELKAEREQIEQAIISLELLAQGRGRKRGRPPAWMAEVTSTEPDPPLPPGAAMPVPRAAADLVWAVSGRKRPAS
jgi:hypothetical protein